MDISQYFEILACLPDTDLRPSAPSQYRDQEILPGIFAA